MKLRNVRSSLSFLVLACAFGVTGEVAAQSYFYTLSGAPGSITCTNTNASISPGLVASWNLPPGTQVRFGVTIGSTVNQQSVESPSASGSEGVSGTSEPYPSAIQFPYTVVVSYTPLTAGAGTSTASFDCASATGTNFRIANAPAFSAPSTSAVIPTLDDWALVALAGILGLASMLAIRRRLSA